VSAIVERVGGQSGRVIELRSDNAAGVAPGILAAVQAANPLSLAYGGDDLTECLQEVVRGVFVHLTARVFPVTSGSREFPRDSRMPWPRSAAHRPT
jgi:hypothetical protein